MDATDNPTKTGASESWDHAGAIAVRAGEKALKAPAKSTSKS